MLHSEAPCSGGCEIANALDIILNATWRGGAATKAAQSALRNLGNTASSTTVELVAAAQRSNLLQNKMQQLGEQVALGNVSVEEARQQYGEFASGLADVGDAAQTAGVGFDKLMGIFGTATAIIAGVTVAVRAAWSTLEQGASLELTARRFDRLAESVGTTGDAFRDDLREATGGMVSDFEAMSLATDLLSLDLASGADQAIRMARVVTELDQDIGQLTLALTNQTTARFDQLNVSTAGFDERLNRLKETMSDEAAFTMAFLEQAEEQIEKVGGASDTAAGDIRRLEAASANLSDSFKVGVVREFTDELSVLGDNAEETGERTGLLGEAVGRGVAQAFRAGLDAMGPFSELLVGLNFILDKLTADDGGLSKATPLLDKFGNAIGEAGAQVEGLEGIAAGSAEELDRLQKAVEDVELQELLEQAGISEDVFTRLAAQLGGVARATAYLQQTMEQGGQVTEAFGVSVEELEKTLGSELFRNRVELWTDFQEDLSTITEREGERRADLEGQWEERRSDVVATYSQQRAEEEEEWQRQRARAEARLHKDILEVQQDAAKDRVKAEARLWQDIAEVQADAAKDRVKAEAQLQQDIGDIQADSSQQQADLRDDANQQLADLEQDHLDRMRQIIEDADLQLQDAASRLDASAVARIQAQREQALAQEEAQYADQRDEIIRTLEERLAEERLAEAQRIAELRVHHAEWLTEQQTTEAERIAELKAHHAEWLAEQQASTAERIAELKAHHAEQQALEAEDRQIRLERQEEAHQEQLRKLDENYSQQLEELRTNSEQQRQEREKQFRADYAQLVDYWGHRQEIEGARQAEALTQIDQFWANVIGGIPTTAAGALAAAGEPIPAGGVPSLPPPPSSSAPPAAPDRPPRSQLEQTATSQMIAAGWTDDQVFDYLRIIKTWSDTRLAKWIEDTFGFDVPGYQAGTPFVPRTGPAILHRGEAVLNQVDAGRWRSGQMGAGETKFRNVTVEAGAIIVNAAPGQSEEMIAMAVERRLESFLREVAG